MINIQDHGAVGDGVHDDTDAIQAVISSCQSTAHLHKLFFPLGTYLISRPIAIRTYMRLVGEGPCSHADPSGIAMAPYFGSSFLASPSFQGESMLTFGVSNGYTDYSGLEGMSLFPFCRAANGITVTNSGENFYLRDVAISRAGKCGLSLRGIHASFTGELLNIGMSGDYDVNCEPDPTSIGWGNGGLVKLIGLSGDDSGIAQIRVTAHHELAIFGLKSEGQKVGVLIDTTDDSPRISFTGTLTFDSAHPNATLIRFTPSSFAHHAVVTADACHNSAPWWIRDERPGGLMLRNDFGVVGRLQYGGANVSYPTKWIAINDNGTTRHIPCW